MSNTMRAVRRLLHSKPHDPPFGTWETVRDKDGKFRCTLRLTDRAQAATGARKMEYKGPPCCNTGDAEKSAAAVFWDDPGAQATAATLGPSNRAWKRSTDSRDFQERMKAKHQCAEIGAKREAQP